MSAKQITRTPPPQLEKALVAGLLALGLAMGCRVQGHRPGSTGSTLTPSVDVSRADAPDLMAAFPRVIEKAETGAGGKTIAIELDDPMGNLLCRWSRLNQTLEINFYQSAEAGKGRPALTRSEIYAVRGEEVDRLPKSRRGLPDLRRLRFETRQFLAKTVYLAGSATTPKPLYHVDGAGAIDEVYTIQGSPSTKEVLRVYAENPGGEKDPWSEAKWKAPNHEALVAAATAVSTFTERRTVDASGRLVLVELANSREVWCTRHEYDDSGRLLFTYMSYQRAGACASKPDDDTVAEVYYTGRQTLDEALKEGVKRTRFTAALKNASGRRHFKGDLESRFDKFARGPAREGFESLPSSLRSKLGILGLNGSTVLEGSVFVPRGGGISVIYRLPQEPLERVIVTDLGFSRTVNADWYGAYSMYGESLTPDNKPLGIYQTTVQGDRNDRIKREALANIVSRWYTQSYYDHAAYELGDPKAPHDTFGRARSILARNLATASELARYQFDRFAHWLSGPPLYRKVLGDYLDGLVQSTSNPPQSEKALGGALEELGIKRNATLTAITFTPVIGGKEVSSAQEVYYRLPDDPLGNYMIRSNAVSSDEEHGEPSLSVRPEVASIAPWWIRGDWPAFQRLTAAERTSPAKETPPIDVSPGSIELQRSAPALGGVTAFGGMLIYQGEDPKDSDDQKQHRDAGQLEHDPDVPALSYVNPHLRFSTRSPKETKLAVDSILEECCSVLKEKERQDVDGHLTRLLKTWVPGYWYRYVSGGDYRQREFHERSSGRVYLREYRQVTTLLRLRGDVPTMKRVYLDVEDNSFRPIAARDEHGNITAVWVEVDVLATGGEKQTIRVKNPLNGRWYTAIEETDPDGLPHIPVPEWSVVIQTSVCLAVAVAGWLAALAAASIRGKKRWERYCTRVEKMRQAPDGQARLYSDYDLQQAAARIADRVLSVNPDTPDPVQGNVRDGNIVRSDGVAEGGFLTYLYPIYAAMIAWRRTAAGNAQLENDQFLFSLDSFAIGIAEYLGREMANGHGLEARYYAACRMNRTCDPDIWEKLTAFLQLFFLDMRRALDAGKDTEDKVRSLLKRYGIHVEGPQPAAEPPGIRIQDFARCIEYHKFVEEAGWEPATKFDSSGQPIPLPRWRQTVGWWARFFGWRTKSIHAYFGQEYADLLPAFLLMFCGMGLVFWNNSSATLVALLVTVLVAAPIGVDLWRCRKTKEDSKTPQGPPWIANRATRIGLRNHGIDRTGRSGWRDFRNGMLFLVAIGLLIAIPWTSNLGAWFLRFTLGIVLLAETWGQWAMSRSLVGLSIYHHFRPSIGGARKKVWGLHIAQLSAFLFAGVAIAYFTYSWWDGHYVAATRDAAGVPFWALFGPYHSLIGAFFYMVITLYLIYTGLWFLLTGFVAGFKTLLELDHGERPPVNSRPGPTDSDQNSQQSGRQEPKSEIILNYVGPDLVTPAFDQKKKVLKKKLEDDPAREITPGKLRSDTETAMAEVCLNQIRGLIDRDARYFARYLLLLKKCDERAPGDASPRVGVWWLRRKARAFVDGDILKGWLTYFYREELKHEASFLHRAQIDDPKMPPELSFASSISEPGRANHRRTMLLGLDVIRQVTIAAGLDGKPVDTAIHVMEIAEALGTVEGKQLPGIVVFIQTYNTYQHHIEDNQPTKEFVGPEDRAIARTGLLFGYLSAGEEAAARYAVAYNWTNVQSKSAAMNGMGLLPERLFRMRALHILDRNANSFEVDKILEDYHRILNDPNLVVLVPLRNTSNTFDPIGRQSEAIEGGHASTLLAVPDKIGTGWENMMGVGFRDVMRDLSLRYCPLLPLSPGTRAAIERDGHTTEDFEYFGLIGFGPNAIGQSEDLWGVLQATHNCVGLGRRPAFELTRAPGTKLRESRRSTEMLNSASRWSGGMIDTERSPINQHINTFGPESIIERKARRCVERFYLAVPVGVLSITVLFPAIFYDLNPFVGLLLAFWAAAFLFNQVLSVHGLVASVRARGPFMRNFPQPPKESDPKPSSANPWLVRGAVTAAVAAGLLAARIFSGFEVAQPVTWVLPGLSALVFGFATLFTLISPSGFAYWLRTRVSDIVLFAPRYFVEASAVLIHLGGGDHSFAASPPAEHGEGILKGLLFQRPTDYKHSKALPVEPLRNWGVIVLVTAAIAFVTVYGVKTGLHWKGFILLSLVTAFAAWAAASFFSKRWARLPVLLAIVIAFVAVYCTRAGLDFNNILLLWLVLAFLGGAATGFFTEDERRGRAHVVLDRIWQAAGAAWGLTTLVGLHQFPTFEALYNEWRAAPRIESAFFIGWICLAACFGLDLLWRGFILLKRRDEEASKSWLRPLYTIERTAVRTIAVLAWFAMVPVPDTIKIAISPDRTLTAGFEYLLLWAVSMAVVVIVIWLIGTICDWRQGAALWAAFEKAAAAYYERLLAGPPAEESLSLTRSSGAVADFIVKMGLGHWADAAKALRRLQAENSARPEIPPANHQTTRAGD